MADDVIRLFEDYATRTARGEEPDARDYLDRAGPDEPKLAALIEEYLQTAPLPEPGEETVEALDSWLSGEGPLLGARRSRKLKRTTVVDLLLQLLGLERRHAGKVTDYYHELEAGLLDTRNVDYRVFDALATILAVPAGVLSWRPRAAPETAVAYYRVTAEPGLAQSAPPVPTHPGPADRDEVDRLFLGVD